MKSGVEKEADKMQVDQNLHLPSFSDIEQAAVRLRPILVQVPLLESAKVNRAVGGRLLIKAETLQPTGSFKVRGAWNRICRCSPREQGRGIVALSSGNHGQAVAWAAKKAGIDRTVVLMPKDTPSNKVERTEGHGAKVVFFDRRDADRQALVAEWQEREDLTYIPAFDDRHVIAGAGTVAVEVVAQAEALGIQLDDFVAACSGGGLVAGSALALEATSPATRVWGVEPESFDDTARSLAQGSRVSVVATASTICDALLSLSPGELTFQVNRRRLSGILLGSDDDARLGMKVAFEEFGLAAEPSGALALGALLANKDQTNGRTIAVVLSGRNVDTNPYASYLSGAA